MRRGWLRELLWWLREDGLYVDTLTVDSLTCLEVDDAVVAAAALALSWDTPSISPVRRDRLRHASKRWRHCGPTWGL